MNGRLSESAVNANDLQAFLSRLPSGKYDNGSLTFNSIQPGLDDTLQVAIPVSYPSHDVVAAVRRWDGFSLWPQWARQQCLQLLRLRIRRSLWRQPYEHERLYGSLASQRVSLRTGSPRKNQLWRR
ncbi:hypothetical protein DFH09DRAFT_1277012 [Mycena vulgaris]|nr:hypothetical protein DFH09DRAFT_1277012 [Mycena vulgaris]